MIASICNALGFRQLLKFGVFLVLMAAMGGSTWAQSEPVLSLRGTANLGGEVELHVKSVGIGVTYVPGFHTVEVTSGGSTVCSAKFDRTFYYTRYFFNGPKSGWYAGAAGYNEKLASSSDCGEDAKSGALPMVGYQWVWDSGFNLDLGLRPGIFALGMSF